MQRSRNAEGVARHMKPLERSNLGRYQRYYRQLGKITEQPKTQAYSTAVFTFLAVSLFGLYAVLPTIRTILFLRREIADKILVNKQMEDKISSLIESQSAYEAVGDRLKIVSDAIPPTAQPIDLALSIRNLSQATTASASSIQIASVPLVGGEATTSGVAQSSSASYPLTIIANGPYSSLKALIDGLLSLKRILTIESMRFMPSTELTVNQQSGVNLQLVLQLKTYYQGP